jgi:4-amino-4-deoxy-L-arabinose transferase-like glycosyltransferase
MSADPGRASRWSAIPGGGPVLVLGLLCIPIILFGLDRYSLVNGDEEVYHVIAATMVESGDWIRLELYGEHRVFDTFLNAPLQYWARAILITLFGDTVWTVRILSALFAVASVFMTFRLARHLGDRRSAFLAGLVQLTTFQFIYLHSARTGELEPIVVFLITLIAFLFIRSVETGRSFVPHHLCLAVLMNIKTPIVLVPLLAELACFALLAQARPAFRRFALSGLVILPFGLTWHAFRMIALWEPFTGVIDRMAEEATGAWAGGRLEGWLFNLAFYGLTLLFGAFPYSLTYPLALTDVLRREQAAGERFRWHVLVLFIAAVLLFYTFIGKHYRWYVMPAYPFLSIMVGSWLARLPARKATGPMLAGLAVLLALFSWIGVSLIDYNPFVAKAFRIPMVIQLHSAWGVSPAIGAVLTFALILALLLGLRRALGPRLPSYLAVGIAAVLLPYGLVRVLLPLRFIDHQSSMALLRSELDARKAAGVPLEYPIDPGIRLRWDARFYLGDEYRIERRERRAFLLHPKQAAGDELR